MPRGLLRFGEFELDRRAFQLRGAGQAVHLERIPLDILFLLVERCGDLVTREEINEKIWGRNRLIDTSNSINTAIRKIRQALGDDLHAPRFVETVTGKGYRFLPSVAAVDTAETSVNTAALQARRVMLAVLPFLNLSNDPAQEYFSDGLTEETIANFGQLGSDQLGIIARTSAMAYKGTSKNIADIGRELGVDFALEGSVRRDHNRVRISAQLIRTSDQTHVWAQQYDRDVQDLLELQCELGRAIASQVEIKLAPHVLSLTGQASTVNQVAYDRYLRGRFHLSKLTRPHLERAIEYFREAAQIDPQMAVTYAGIADAQAILPITSEAVPEEVFPLAEQAARKALEIDGRLAEAHCALASLNFWYKWDWTASETHSREAIACNPSHARAHMFYAHLLSNIGRHSEAIAEIEIARQFDPYSPIINTHCAQFRYHAGRYAEAIPILERTLELAPDFWVAYIVLAKTYQQLGRLIEARTAAEKGVGASVGNTEALSLLGYAEGVAGRQKQAQRVLAELQQASAQRYVPPYNFAVVYLGLGDRHRALEWLEKAYVNRDVHMVFLAVEPKWRRLRDEPRFFELLRRVGLPG
ncbi:MAG: winged helix-turn-helix domain-containing protein [Gammaproteobacteria bacterium]|nr:winged helix-turn-helix domain-containing protein [Gammaproteobacteria bacterium]